MCESLVSAINAQIEKDIDGYIKIGFEGGKPVGISQYNNPTEGDFPEVKSDFSLKDEISRAMDANFFGTLGFVFTNRKITRYYRVQNWKSNSLSAFLRKR